MTRPLVKDVRKNIPLSIKLAVALRMLGFVKGQRVNFDHHPALGLRDWDEEKRDFIPPQLDPEFIVIRTKPVHDKKTNGNGATSYGSDKHAIAKIVRVRRRRGLPPPAARKGRSRYRRAPARAVENPASAIFPSTPPSQKPRQLPKT